jgi:hypothetical protein
VSKLAARCLGALCGVLCALSDLSAWAGEPTEQAASPSSEPRPGWERDAEGRVFRTSFDPGRRMVLGLGWAPRFSSNDLTADPFLVEVGLFDRQLLDYELERVTWKLTHEALVGRAEISSALDTRLDATLYLGRFMRWSRDGSISLPSSPGDSVPFPLNIGVEGEVGRLELARRHDQPAADARAPSSASVGASLPARAAVAAELGVARAEVLLDFWRQRDLRSHAGVGFGPSYELWLWGAPDGRIDHWVSPFTSGSVAVHHEWDQGRQLFDLRGSGGWALCTDGRGSARARIGASYELTLLAVDDLPVSLGTSVAYRFEQAPHPTGEAHELTATASLRLGIPLAR